MICARLDNELRRLAQSCRCSYTRYADDITFSTTLASFPRDLAVVEAKDGACDVYLSAGLREVIHRNGFGVNADKVRLLDWRHRQEVTGLVVNRHPNVRRSMVRQIRAMLHAWRRHGLEAAQAEYLTHYDRKHRKSGGEPPSFRKVVKGKIDFLGMVLRGRPNRVYRRFLAQYAELDPDFVLKDETGWDKVDRQIKEARKRLSEASTVEHHQAVGLLCREVLISLAQAVYSPDRHGTTDGTDPSTADAPRMIDAYLAVELKGSHDRDWRRLARAAVDLALHLQHARTATLADARSCLSSTEFLVNQIAVIDGESNSGNSGDTTP